MHGTKEDVYGFGDNGQPPPPPRLPTDQACEAHPTHLDALTLRLSPERYQRLARALSALLDEAHAEGHSGGSAAHCTLAVLAFQHDDGPEGERLSRNITSFRGADPGADQRGQSPTTASPRPSDP